MDSNDGFDFFFLEKYKMQAKQTAPSTRPNATPTNCIHTNYSRQHLHQLHRHLGIPTGTTHSRYPNIPRSHYVTNLSLLCVWCLRFDQREAGCSG